jgi:hypothetical protein
MTCWQKVKKAQNYRYEHIHFLCGTGEQNRGHLLGCSDLQDIHDALPGNMAEPEKESYLYWETHKRMMAKYVDCGHRKKKVNIDML